MEIEENIVSSNQDSSQNKQRDEQTSTVMVTSFEPKKLQVCNVTQIYQQPQSQRMFMLIGDIMINIDQSQDILFSETLRFNKQHRPVTTIQKNKGINFSRINFDFSASGLKDFRFVIHILESMQNVEMYKLSKTLEQLQYYVNEEIKSQKSIPYYEYDQKRELFCKFQETVLPKILKEEQQQNPNAFQIYFLGSCVDGKVNSKLTEMGVNNNYLDLIGSDQKTMETFYIREGFFESSWLLHSIELTNMFLERYVSSYALYKGFTNFEPIKHNMLTLDLILLPAVYSSKLYYFYNTEDLFYSKHLIPELVDNIVGAFCIITIDIENEDLLKLKQLRAQKNTLQNNNLILNYIENNMAKFQYEIQSEHFFEKYYSKPIKPQTNELSLYDLYPGRVCSYRNLK